MSLANTNILEISQLNVKLTKAGVWLGPSLNWYPIKAEHLQVQNALAIATRKKHEILRMDCFQRVRLLKPIYLIISLFQNILPPGHSSLLSYIPSFTFPSACIHLGKTSFGMPWLNSWSSVRLLWKRPRHPLRKPWLKISTWLARLKIWTRQTRNLKRRLNMPTCTCQSQRQRQKQRQLKTSLPD